MMEVRSPHHPKSAEKQCEERCESSRSEYVSLNDNNEITGLSSRFLTAESVTGRCYVLTFSSKHNVTLADLSPSEILPIINTWAEIYAAHLSPNSPISALAASNAAPSTDAWHLTVPKEQLRY